MGFDYSGFRHKTMSDAQNIYQRFLANFANIISISGTPKLEGETFVIEVNSRDTLDRLTMVLPDMFEGHPVVVYDPSSEAEGEV